MKRFCSFFVAMLMGTTCLFAQTNYTVTFSANVEMDRVQVTNTVSGETKTLYMPDNVITLQKNKQQETAVETVDNSAFLQQTGENTVVVNMEQAGHVNLTLYSLNGTFVARYSNNVDAGPNTFKIGAASGVYVLVASANNQSASLKLSLTQNSQPSILEVLTDKPEPLLKSLDDVITYDEGDEFEFIGYYQNQTDIKTAVISGNQEIVFAFKNRIENGTIYAAFSVSDTQKIYFSQGNLQYQASTGTWRFAEHQYDIIGEDNADISSSNPGWIDLFGWGTSSYKGRYPYMTSTTSGYYGNGSSDIAGTNYDWGVYNKISNGGNQAGMWRTLTKAEWNYLINERAQASRLRGQGNVNNVNGLILLPNDWETPSSVKFTCGTDNPYESGDYSTNVYSLEEWAVMQSYGAVFLPAAGARSSRSSTTVTYVGFVGSYGYYWSSSSAINGGNLAFDDGSYAYILFFYNTYMDVTGNCFIYGQSVRLVQDVK